MTQEQKAKAYDEALERMKSWVRGEYPECFTEAQKAAEFIFPELKESEDEKIIREITAFFRKVAGGYLDASTPCKTYSKWLTWFEKLCEKKTTNKMTQEEKAKRYDEALKEAKDCHIDGLALSQPVKDVLEHIFPELKESEYEQLRKEIISIVKTYRENCITEGNHRFDDCLTWLENQRELNYSNATISDNKKIKAFLTKTIQQISNDSLLWEKIDKASVLAWIEKHGVIRLQNSCKPSDMELETLRLIAEKDGTCLMSLYEKLKKLK